MLKVASYNIQKCFGMDGQRRPERTLEVIAELECDVIALQEADRRFGPRLSPLDPRQIAARTGFRPVPVAMTDGGLGWHGNALLVREGIEVEACHRLALPALEPRGAIMADLSVNGEKIRIAATHLGLLGVYRQRQIERLMQILHPQANSRPTVLMGDLNEWRDAALSLKLFSPHFTVTSPGKSYPALLPMANLDRIITSPELTVRQSGVHRSRTSRMASDHLPVWADLSLQSA